MTEPAVIIDFDDLEPRNAGFIEQLLGETSAAKRAVSNGTGEEDVKSCLETLRSDLSEFAPEDYDEGRVADYLFRNPEEVIGIYEDMLEVAKGRPVDLDYNPEDVAEGVIEALETLYKKGFHSPQYSSPAA